MSSLPVLTYFNLYGRAEIVRILLAQAGVEYEDRRVTKEEWVKIKPESPTGQVPMLEINGVKICQSPAIARYVAAEHGLYGDTNLEKALIDMVFDTFKDFMEPWAKNFGQPDKSLQEKYYNEAVEKSKESLKLHERWLTESGTGFYVGSKITMADVMAMFIISYSDTLKYAGPLVTKHVNMMTSQPRIKAWLENRPKSEY